MARKPSGFGKLKLKRTEPREIGPSPAAPEPSQQTPELFCADDSEPHSGWQSGWTANAETFSLVRECCPVWHAILLVLGGG